MHEIDKSIAAVRRLTNSGRCGVLVTLVATTGSTYRRAGARVVISEEGEACGAISGGCLEHDLAERVRPLLAEMRPRLLCYDTTQSSDIVFGLGVGCRGTMDVLVEPFDIDHLPPLATSFEWHGRDPVVWTTSFEGRELLTEIIRPQHALVVFGGGLDVKPVIKLAELVGWRVSVISPRDVHPEEVRERVNLDSFDAAIVMTHNFLHDLALIGVLLPSAIRYVGLLGPKARGEELLERLGVVEPRFVQKLHSPIGLDLGGETPEEIALSIVAEVQKVFSGATGESLRESAEPLHARPSHVPV